MLDELAQFNQARWEALVSAEIAYARPWLDLDIATARQRIDPVGLLGAVQGKTVLCLGCGGGQQSAALALLGGRVTVLDLTAGQLARDQQAAAHYGLPISTEQGDMRDLSRFADRSFDLVYQAYSINFIPDPTVVFSEVARLLRPGSRYFVQWHNPFTQGVDEESWDGRGYRLSRLYRNEEVLAEFFSNPDWPVEGTDGVMRRVEGPREFRHTLSTILNGLIATDFALLGIQEETGNEPNPDPGSWEHYKQVTAWILSLWTVYQPE